MKSKIVQQCHNKKGCGQLGSIIKIKVVRDNIFGTPIEIKIIWKCQECHDKFETHIPYLEIYKL